MKYFFILPILLLTGCAQIPQWETPFRQAAEAELEDAQTQLEMNSAMAAIAANAEKRMLTALEYKLSILSQTKRLALLYDQREWQRLMDRRNQESMGDGSIAPMMQRGREEKRLKNRFTELTVPEEERQAFIAMKNFPIRFQGKVISLKHGELDFTISDEKWEDDRPKFETIAQLNIPYCREIKAEKDTFWLGIIEPTNFGVVSSFGEGTESNLCVWKNGKNSANFLIGKKITVRDISVFDGTVKVSFLDEAGVLQQKEFNYQIPNSDSVLINHWTTERIN